MFRTAHGLATLLCSKSICCSHLVMFSKAIDVIVIVVFISLTPVFLFIGWAIVVSQGDVEQFLTLTQPVEFVRHLRWPLCVLLILLVFKDNFAGRKRSRPKN